MNSFKPFIKRLMHIEFCTVYGLSLSIPLISNLARAHSREMANGKVPFGHRGFEQRAQILMQRFSYREIAENVGYNMGYTNPASEVVEGWLHSPEHLKNIEISSLLE
jgi:hypothetical protein